MDSSFLYNAFQLDIFPQLCFLFEKIFLVPSVLLECKRFQTQFARLKCIEIVILTDSEKKEVEKLHKEFVAHFPGKHLGEVECLVFANSRNEPLVISDNYAPWFLQNKHPAYNQVEIHRGWWVIGRLIEINKLDVEFLVKIEGRYPQKAIEKLRSLFKNE